MLIFPQVAKSLVCMVSDALYSSCSKEESELAGSRWIFCDDVRECLATLLMLDCVPGDYSISRLADTLFNIDFDFEGEINE